MSSRTNITATTYNTFGEARAAAWEAGYTVVAGRRLADGTLDTSIMQRPCGNDVVRLVAGINCCQWAAV